MIRLQPRFPPSPLFLPRPGNRPSLPRPMTASIATAALEAATSLREYEAFVEYHATFAAFSSKPYHDAMPALATLFERTIHHAFVHYPNAFDWGKVKRHPLARVAEIASLADMMADENGQDEITGTVLEAAAHTVICEWRARCHDRLARFQRFNARPFIVFCAGYAELGRCPEVRPA